ncbi:hypothetical protein ACRRTK_023575 [Alexandromys fortis]
MVFAIGSSAAAVPGYTSGSPMEPPRKAVTIAKAKVDFSSVVCLPPSVIAVNGLDGGGAGENDDEPVLLSLSAAPSPQSEAVANELQELSLQPELTLGLHPGRNPNLPPLSERKNGSYRSGV